MDLVDEVDLVAHLAKLVFSVNQYQSHFVGHPTRKVPGIEQNTGALGHGLSVAVGLALAAILIYVINIRSFGWSLKMSVSPELLGQAMLVSVGAALLAGIYPAFKLSLNFYSPVIVGKIDNGGNRRKR